MRRPRADLRDDGEDAILRERRGLGRRQIARDDDARLLNVGQRRRARPAAQRSLQEVRDEHDVVAALGEIRIPTAAQLLGKVVRDDVDGPLHAQQIDAHLALDFVFQGLVGEHQSIRFEDRRFRFREPPRSAVRHLRESLNSELDGHVEALQLLFGLVLLDASPNDTGPQRVDDDGAPDGETRRTSNPVEDDRPGASDRRRPRRFVTSFLFPEPSVDQFDRWPSPRPPLDSPFASTESSGALGPAEQEQTHDALGVDRLPVVSGGHLARKARRELRELRRGAGVQPKLVSDQKSSSRDRHRASCLLPERGWSSPFSHAATDTSRAICRGERRRFEPGLRRELLAS